MTAHRRTPATGQPAGRETARPSALRSGLAVASGLAAASALACAGAALGLACGAASRSPARSVETRRAVRPDVEDGWLSRASRGIDADSDDRFALSGAGGNAYGGAVYGGVAIEIRPNADGGTRYGNYRFAGSRRRTVRRPYGLGYRGTDVTNPGAITGRVIWPRPPDLAPPLPGKPAACAEPPELAPGGGVPDAVVYLRDIRRGRRGPRTSRYQKLQTGGVLDLGACRAYPRVQVISPLGSLLRLHNGDAAPRTFTGSWLADGGAVVLRRPRSDPAPLFSLSLAPGAREDLYLDEPGTLRVSTGSLGDVVDAGAAGDAGGAGGLDSQVDLTDPAWVVVPGHPYYDVTDESGRFRLGEIPPGRYQLAVWYPPVRTPDGVTRPVTATATATVSAGRTRAITVSLPRASLSPR